MAPQTILDSHIHLWPHSAANSNSHGWMKPGEHLTRQYSIEDYLIATSTAISEHSTSTESNEYDLKGFIYVETDRMVQKTTSDDVHIWAAEPLREIAFLRRMVEGTPEDGESGFDSSQANLLKGIVAWAPLDRGIAGFQQYLAAAKEVAGAKAWRKIRGCRFLLQGIRDKVQFEQLAQGQEFVDLLKLLGEEGWSFDVGIDQRSGGIWQLFSFAEVIEKVHDGVGDRDQTVFILNHLCKPDMKQIPGTEEYTDIFWHWKTAMSSFAACDNVYIKLSGAFSEMVNQNPDTGGEPLPVSKIVEITRPWIKHIVFDCFGPKRIMFGSDWPVCNVQGPSDQLTWARWKEVVAILLEDFGLSSEDKDRIWYGTAVEAYRLEGL
ncbi:amidohydrolase 2 [Tothia fuscella]|uniref:Amidohydrolase 2 n=1 Tax=Tothia fuscella TaxID=1048955 RepID=A0A9P4NQH4_9PEZI|nr:amidohydrolase 2 [Tothia fuscella]